MSRLIDADAIRYTEYRCRDMLEDGSYSEPYSEYRVDKKRIDAMPTVEPQKWTPCSQEMPDKDGWYLCSYESRLVQRCVFYCGEWMNGNADINRILAWMPLPSPYIWRE